MIRRFDLLILAFRFTFRRIGLLKPACGLCACAGQGGELMSRRRYKDAKKKREKGAFLALPMTVLNSYAYTKLSPFAVKLLLDLGSQYRGNNNGDLCAAWKVMRPRGWRSEVTLGKAKKELLLAGFIFEARKGRRPNICSLYAVTWQDLDHSIKHDVGPKSFLFGAWKVNEPVPSIKSFPVRQINKIPPTTSNVVADTA